jgi:hypothetical protein
MGNGSTAAAYHIARRTEGRSEVGGESIRRKFRPSRHKTATAATLTPAKGLAAQTAAANAAGGNLALMGCADRCQTPHHSVVMAHSPPLVIGGFLHWLNRITSRPRK